LISKLTDNIKFIVFLPILLNSKILHKKINQYLTIEIAEYSCLIETFSILNIISKSMLFIFKSQSRC